MVSLRSAGVDLLTEASTPLRGTWQKVGIIGIDVGHHPVIVCFFDPDTDSDADFFHYALRFHPGFFPGENNI